MNSINHFYFDGYDIDNELLNDVEHVKNFISEINDVVENGTGKITLMPYFDGKIKRDGGISCCIIADNFHFTCHTFSFKNTVFIDCFGFDNCKEKLLPIILKYYKTDNYDLCTDNIGPGKFGKHIILSSSPISYDEGLEVIKTLLKDIEMTPIHDVITNYKDESHFDLLQPIAESHISIHRNDEEMTVDIFSCKDFDENKVYELFGDSIKDSYAVNRGVYYKQ